MEGVEIDLSATDNLFAHRCRARPQWLVSDRLAERYQFSPDRRVLTGLVAFPEFVRLCHRETQAGERSG
jgi:hypothetical protein